VGNKHIGVETLQAVCWHCIYLLCQQEATAACPCYVSRLSLSLSAAKPPQYLKVEGPDTIHIGDQFLSTGNDLSARRACTTSWVSSPEETITVLQNLVADLEVQGIE